jgi:hypothetical protein
MKTMKYLKYLPKTVKNRFEIRRLIANYFFFREHIDKTSFGSITREEEEGIKRAVELAEAQEGSMVEIGALFGHTTNLIASFKSREKELIAVENYSWNPFVLPKEAHQLFLKRTLRYVTTHANVNIYEGDAASFYKEYANAEISMVFIDAMHDYQSVIQDIDWALSVGCKVISGHDYTELHPGVVKAVDERFGDAIEVYGSVWVHAS